MPEYGYRLKFAPRIADVMQTYSPEEQDEVERVFGLVQIDPVPDPTTKVVLTIAPAVFTVHHTRAFWVAYHVVGSEIRVVNVGRASEEPTHR